MVYSKLAELVPAKKVELSGGWSETELPDLVVLYW